MNRNVFKKFMAGLAKINEILLFVVVLVMFVILLAQIFVRFLFFVPLPASQDLLLFTMVTSVFLGSGLAVRNNKQIALDFIVEALPKRFHDYISGLTDLIAIFFLSILVNQSFQKIGETMETVVGASPLKVGHFYIVVFIGCILMSVYYFAQFLTRFFRVTGLESHLFSDVEKED